MRCTQVDRLVDAYVDGRLAPLLAREVEAHTRGCARCRASLAMARVVSDALVSAAPITAPAGFADRVMGRVYRQALAAKPAAAEAGTGRTARTDTGGAAAARTYRRLGFSFMLTATVLAASLLVPRAAYPRLFGIAGAQVAEGSATLVQTVMTGAGDTVRGALGESGRGGTIR